MNFNVLWKPNQRKSRSNSRELPAGVHLGFHSIGRINKQCVFDSGRRFFWRRIDYRIRKTECYGAGINGWRFLKKCILFDVTFVESARLSLLQLVFLLNSPLPLARISDDSSRPHLSRSLFNQLRSARVLNVRREPASLRYLLQTPAINESKLSNEI